ncbi:MAG: AsmA family protein [Inquilinus sp.]|nr:AsmA family protein [Inquilinus sp.]
MKNSTIAFLAVVVLILAAALFGPGLIDWNGYRDQVTARINAVTGLQLAIEGDIELAVLPRPRLRAGGVHIGTLSGGLLPDMASVDELEVEVALMPLLGGEIQVEHVALLRPLLIVETQPDGRTNWSAGAGMAGSVRLDRVSIADGTLVWRDGLRGREERLTALDVDLAAASLAGPLQAAGSANLRGVPLTFDLSSGRVTAAGALPMTLTLGLRGAPGSMRLAGIASFAGGFQGDISAEAPSAADILSRIWPGRSVSSVAAGPVRFEAEARLDAEAVELNGVAIEFGDMRATGAVNATLTEFPRLDVALALNRLDLDAWLAAAGEAGAGARSDPLGFFLDEWRGGFALPRTVSATADITVEAMTYRGGLVRQMRLEGLLGEGVVSIGRLTAQLPGGSDFALAGTLQAEAGQPRFDVDVQTASSDLRGVLEWLGHRPETVPRTRLRRFTGTASLIGQPRDFQVTGFDLSVDGARLAGGLAYVDRGRPGIGLRLEASRLNLDAYRPTGAPPLLGADGWQAIVDLLGGFDANLDLTLEGLTADGIAARDVRLDATVNGGAIALRQAAIGDLAGASLALSGGIGGLQPLAGLDLDFAFTAPAAERLARTVGVELAPPLAGLETLSLSGRLGGSVEALSLEVSGAVAGGSLELGGTVERDGPEPVYDLAVRLIHPDLGTLAGLFDAGYRPRGPLGGMDLYGEITGTPADLGIDNLQGTIGGVTLAGHCAIRRGGVRPSVDLVLRASEIALDPWLRTESRSGRAARRWSSEPFATGLLTAVDGSLSLTAIGLSAGGLRLADPIVDARLADGVVELSSLTGGLFDGEFGASGRVAAGDEKPELALRLDLAGADATDALAFSVGNGGLAGRLDLGIDIAATGASPMEMVASLSGEGLLAIRDGRAAGIDLVAAAARLQTMADPIEFLDLQREALAAGETAFAALNATLLVAEGMARTDDLRLVAGDAIGTGAGNFDLSRWQVDLTTRFDLAARPAVPDFAVRLIGPPDDPERVLQTAELQAFIARRAADAVSRRYGAVPSPSASPAN